MHKPGATSPPPALINVVWRRLAPLLPPTQRTGRPFAHDRRRVVEAIVYVMQSNCAWRTLPSRFPPWQTVYAQFSQWRITGIWETIWAGLEQPHSL
jgi:putative transposase